MRTVEANAAGSSDLAWLLLYISICWDAVDAQAIARCGLRDGQRKVLLLPIRDAPRDGTLVWRCYVKKVRESEEKQTYRRL